MPKLKLTRKEWFSFAALAGYFGVFLALFLTNSDIEPPRTNLLAAGLVSVLAWKCLFYPRHPGLLKVFRSRGAAIALGLIAVYSSLASFGHRLLSMDEMRMQLHADDVLYLLLGAVWFVPVLLSLLYLAEAAIHRERKPAPPRPALSSRAAWWIIFGALSLIQTVLLFSFAPGGYGNDAVYEYMQAIGALPLDDWHPIINALMERLLLRIVPSPAFITWVQMELYAFLVTEFLAVLLHLGWSFLPLLVGGCVFMLLPNQVMNSITVVKDMPYMYTVMGTTLLLFKLLTRPGYEKKHRFWIGMAVSLFFMMTYRHNGPLPAAILILTCVILAVRCFRQHRDKAWRLLLGPVIAIAAFGVYKGPVTSTLQPAANTSSTYVTMLCGVANVIANDLPLSEESTAIMEEVIPLSEWKTYYSRFEGHDRYMWDRGPDAVFDASSITASKAFHVYLEALMKYPDLILKDRLDGMDILWNMRRPDDSFNVRYFDYVDNSFGVAYAMDLSGLTLHDNNKWYAETPIANLYRKLCDLRPYTCLENQLLWQSGAYIILLLVLMLFWQTHRCSEMWIVSIPLLANLFCSLLGVYHQSFRYVYYIQVMVIALTLMTLAKAYDRSKEAVSL